jgi:hypothetical protein
VSAFKRILSVLLLALFATPATAPAMSDAFAMSNGDKPLSSEDTGETVPGPRTGATGILRGPGGQPVAGAMIVARSLDEPAKPIPEIAIITNDQGSYAWPLRPGRYELTPMLDGSRGAPEEVSVEAGSMARRDLTMPR